MTLQKKYESESQLLGQALPQLGSSNSKSQDGLGLKSRQKEDFKLCSSSLEVKRLINIRGKGTELLK